MKKVKRTLHPLFREGDLFKIVKLNIDEELLPIEAMRIKNGAIYGFYEDELEDVL